MAAKSKWVRKVARVFNLYPRIGPDDGVFWYTRAQATSRFAEAFERPGAHVCLDGPTGAGKTSLALTQLVQSSVRHAAVQVTSELDWAGFCRQVLTPPTANESSIEGGLEFGVDKGLPVVKCRVSLGDKGRPLDDEALREKLSNTWTEHDVARQLASENTLLLVDDLERGSDRLLRRLSDLCKLLTQTFVAENAKVVLVGSGDIYRRLHHENPALEERLLQVTLGGFQSPMDSIAFITRGFRALRLRHPWNSGFVEQRQKADLCKNRIWEAADGLPKSLNMLGQEIALRAEGRSGVTWHEIVNEADKMAETHWVEYANRFPTIVDFLHKQPVAAAVVGYLYEQGIAKPHRVSQIQQVVAKGSGCSYAEVEAILEQLVIGDFLIRTGKTGEITFVKHPTAAHSLGVAMREPGRFKHIADPARGQRPLPLAFPMPVESGEREGADVDTEWDDA